MQSQVWSAVFTFVSVIAANFLLSTLFFCVMSGTFCHRPYYDFPFLTFFPIFLSACSQFDVQYFDLYLCLDFSVCLDFSACLDFDFSACLDFDFSACLDFYFSASLDFDFSACLDFDFPACLDFDFSACLDFDFSASLDCDFSACLHFSVCFEFSAMSIKLSELIFRVVFATKAPNIP